MPKIKAFSYIHEPGLQRLRARVHEIIREGWEPSGGLTFANGEYVQAVSKPEEAGPALEGGAPARKDLVDHAIERDALHQAVKEWRDRCTIAEQNASFIHRTVDDLRSKLGEARNDAASWCEAARAELAKVEELQKLAKTHGTDRIKELEAACDYHYATIKRQDERIKELVAACETLRNEVASWTLSRGEARRESEGWEKIAAQNQRNSDYFRDLLDKCAEHLGKQAFTADDGGVHDTPLRAKVPELVADLAARVRYHEETIRQLNERHDQFYQGYNRQKLLLNEAIELVRSAKQFLGPLSTAYTLFAKLANFLGRIDKMPSCG